MGVSDFYIINTSNNQYDMKSTLYFLKYIISQYLAIPRIFTDKKQGLSYPRITHKSHKLNYCIMVKRVLWARFPHMDHAWTMINENTRDYRRFF